MARNTAIEVRGLRQTQRKMEQVATDLAGKPMVDAMKQATMLVERDAKIFAPVDTGRLRASITSDIRVASSGLLGKEVQGVVGSNVTYAPFMELGTGTFAGRPRYFPPPEALEVWARRHGIASGFLVARAIFRRGGLRGRKFLERGFENNTNKIIALIGRAVNGIVG